ncbi:alpha/beta hydrolase [Paucibacter sp. APW11]|uniref:Alpha/beta hydrolase n=1 Tax=Roseateles aquae TaxID=3077235 RepID=A0ABU3P6X1_9BURK|nr:alpha/beta hydrolase [Paucibacter sp. APW11]MDT8998322.1 alpha/beta hydrolase [Paucibacter sp. APW11]
MSPTLRKPHSLTRLIQGALLAIGLAGSMGSQAATATATASTTTASTAADTAVQFKDLRITVRGDGQPLLMIPGLNSAASVWDETCAKLQPGVQCLMVQLPGFAGAPASPAFQQQFLASARGQLLDYLREQAPQGASVVGHSLGGVLALQMAAEAKAPIKRLVIVDSLPFLAGIQNPNATVDSVKPMAEGMRAGMMRPASPEQRRATLAPMAATMVHGDTQIETVVQWGIASDAASTAAAMYELWVSDLRPMLPQVKVPTTVLGSWAAYAPMGSTLESTRAIFERQYEGLKGVELKMSTKGFHFLMWDDAELVSSTLKQALR